MNADRDRSRAQALAAEVERRGALSLPQLAATFEQRGYSLPGFSRALVHALDAGLVEWEPGYYLKATP